MKTVARSSVGCVSKVIAAKPVLVAEGKNQSTSWTKRVRTHYTP